MANTFSLLFYLKRSKADINGEANIYLRITMDGQRAEMSLHRKVMMNRWDQHIGKMIGRNTMAREINEYIDLVTYKINKLYQNFIDQGKYISPRELIKAYRSFNVKPKMLLEIFRDHNKKMEALMGKQYSEGTVKRYRTTLNHLEQHLKEDLLIDDIAVTEVDLQFLNRFDYFLKSIRGCNHNSSMKYLNNLKKIMRIAYVNEWILKDPFYNFKISFKWKEREYLTEHEIETLLNKDLHNQRLELVRDIFVFCCFTGLAYADVKKLTPRHVVKGIDGGKWIRVHRTKTNSRSSIPILPTAMSIIKKYEAYPEVVNEGCLLPVPSNQKSNAYLKEIADLCGINKNLTTHLARHTFATTVTLSNGVPIESVSKMLGHKDLRTTQIYAKVIDKKVGEDMKVLRERIKSNI
ncbi:site-specific integrase [Zhouia spongiae]|uniref:Site-specific integrase n=1 Tax=Zhouia spongiae TaxID=2202721 RepID=A0ABY3YL89_9FLAO|nr:site-specific integrase [Zhouia spongiae]UNY98364.1 site-specific integrase [Zhouia spongiae]